MRALRMSFMSWRRGSARIERLPRARGPNSMRPWNQPTILPSARAVAVQLAQHRELDLLQPPLQRGRDVAVTILERFLAGGARGTEGLDHARSPQGAQLGHPTSPGHGGALAMVAEVVQVEAKFEALGA